LNYDDQKLASRYFSVTAAQRGTDLHNLAHEAVRLGVKLSKTNRALSTYVNDAIGYKMVCEQPLFYSENCFGTADCIAFRRSKLRIHDLKTGIVVASEQQLEVYAALFCLEYSVDPYSIDIELRIYQRDEIRVFEPFQKESFKSWIRSFCLTNRLKSLRLPIFNRGVTSMKLEEEAYLAHYGVIRRSGRYPWGSGGYNEAQRSKQFLDYVEDLKAKGLTESMIAKGYDMSINQLRASRSIAINQQRQANIAMAQRLKDKGWSNTAIGKRMQAPESTVRSWLAPGAKDKADVIQTTAKMLKSHIKPNTYLDVGKGVENYTGVSRTRMDTAIEVLRQQGYELIAVKAPQQTTGFDTNMKVLAPAKQHGQTFIIIEIELHRLHNFLMMVVEIMLPLMNQ
jgi:hypothetical protein